MQCKTEMDDSFEGPSFVSDNGNKGLGNLADELADAWDEDEDIGMTDQDPLGSSTNGSMHATTDTGRTSFENVRDSGVDVASFTTGSPVMPTKEEEIDTSQAMIDSIMGSPRKRQRRRTRPSYEGSGYYHDAEEVDDEDAGLSNSLQDRMADIETLAREGVAQEDGVASRDEEQIIHRTIARLQDLGRQSGIEGSAARLSTAHTALSTHLAHQTRTILALTQPLLSPLSIPPDPASVEALIPLLAHLITIIPRPSPTPLTSLSHLSQSSRDLAQRLSGLSDTLQMLRQKEAEASRRLKSAREFVSDMRRESEVVDEARRWITEGCWERRVREREGGRVCGEVVGGFEKVCEEWRERLVRSAAATEVSG